MCVVAAVSLAGCSTYKAVYDHEETRNNYRGCALMNTDKGIISTVYDDKSRKNSELWINWQRAYVGSQETIGQGIEHNGSLYFPVECGKGLVYDGKSIRETVKLRHCSCAIVYKGVPCFVSSEDNGEFVINAETGEKIKQLNVPSKFGIPFSAAEFEDGEWIIVLADHGGAEVLVTTTDKVIPLSGVTTVVNKGGTIIAGANGVLYEVNIKKESTKKYKETGSDVVNDLWYSFPNLLVSCSGKDQLISFDLLGKKHTVISFDDGDKPRYFDGRITDGWWLRNVGSKAQYYRLE